MLSSPERTLLPELQPLSGGAGDYDQLLERIGDASVVLLGEASHGTHEFYRERARITRRLIDERGFCGVAVEADWPDAYRVNRYVHGASEDGDAEEALRGFRRFPTWMWRNAEVVDFVGWLRARNDRVGAGARRRLLRPRPLQPPRLGGGGDRLPRPGRPGGGRRARERYSCFEAFGGAQAYGRAASLGIARVLPRGRRRPAGRAAAAAAAYLRRDGIAAEDEQFYAEQNARLVTNAEEYYRSMFGAPDVLLEPARPPHDGDAGTPARAPRPPRRLGPAGRLGAQLPRRRRARDAMGRRGELNLGQLARERWGDDVFSLGFTTYEGTVTAASGWDAPAERKRVRPALPHSYERLFHELGEQRFLLDLRRERAAQVLGEPRLERAIGVIYRPETERASHYFSARLADQFDAVIHIDRTRAVEPLERTTGWEAGEPPETYPSAL